MFINSVINSMILVSFLYHSMFQVNFQIKNITSYKSDGAKIQFVLIK